MRYSIYYEIEHFIFIVFKSNLFNESRTPKKSNTTYFFFENYFMNCCPRDDDRTFTSCLFLYAMLVGDSTPKYTA